MEKGFLDEGLDHLVLPLQEGVRKLLSAEGKSPLLLACLCPLPHCGAVSAERVGRAA